MGMMQRFRAAIGRPRGIEKELTALAGGMLAAWPLTNGYGIDRFQLFRPDDLLGRYGFRIYREMLHDDTVKACLKFKKVLVHGRKFVITPAGGKDATQQDKDIAEFVEKTLYDTEWNRIQREMLTALDFGFSVGEILWEVKPDKVDTGQLRVALKDIKFRDPEQFWIDVDVHGNIVQFRQYADWIAPHPTNGVPSTEIWLPPEKMFHMAYQGQFSNHYGWSDLRACYRAWWSKKFITQFWNVFLERFGSPLMMMKYPQGSSDQLKDALKSILTNLQSKTDILVPEGVEVELIEAARAGAAKYEEALTYCDVGISRSILVPALLGMGVDVKRGSDSQSRLHLRVLMKVADDLSQDIAYRVNEKIIRPLVDYNFDVKDYPVYSYGDYGEYEAVELADSITQMFSAGILDLDQEDVNFLRSITGLPLREEGDEDEVNRPQPTPLMNPGQGNAGPGGAAGAAGAKPGNNRAGKGPSRRANKSQNA